MVTRTCSSCGATNRIPARNLADHGKCGRCKAALDPLAAPLPVGDAATFDEIVQRAKVPVLVDFWAAWCGPCRMVAPELASAAAALAGRAVVLKVDTEAVPDLARRFRIQSIPAFIVFRGGRPVFEQAGAVRQSDFVRWIDQAATRAA